MCFIRVRVLQDFVGQWVSGAVFLNPVPGEPRSAHFVSLIWHTHGTLVDLNLKKGVFTSFCNWNQILMFTHVYIVLKVKRWSVHMPLERRCYSDLSRHIKEPQNGIVRISLKKKRSHLKAKTLFIPKVTCFVYSVSMLLVFLLACVFHCVRAAWHVGRSNSNEGGRFLQRINCRV